MYLKLPPTSINLAASVCKPASLTDSVAQLPCYSSRTGKLSCSRKRPHGPPVLPLNTSGLIQLLLTKFIACLCRCVFRDYSICVNRGLFCRTYCIPWSPSQSSTLSTLQPSPACQVPFSVCKRSILTLDHSSPVVKCQIIGAASFALASSGPRRS
ncbi:MAG: hypothetical protein ACI955_001934 [Zhongshania sp.]|jgi:hypothetical protein